MFYTLTDCSNGKKSKIIVHKNMTFWVLLFIFILECAEIIASTYIYCAQFWSNFSIFYKFLLYAVILYNNNTTTPLFQFLLPLGPIYFIKLLYFDFWGFCIFFAYLASPSKEMVFIYRLICVVHLVLHSSSFPTWCRLSHKMEPLKR